MKNLFGDEQMNALKACCTHGRGRIVHFSGTAPGPLLRTTTHQPVTPTTRGRVQMHLVTSCASLVITTDADSTAVTRPYTGSHKTSISTVLYGMCAAQTAQIPHHTCWLRLSFEGFVQFRPLITPPVHQLTGAYGVESDRVHVVEVLACSNPCYGSRR